jgi:hypothetical protein
MQILTRGQARLGGPQRDAADGREDDGVLLKPEYKVGDYPIYGAALRM